MPKFVSVGSEHEIRFNALHSPQEDTLVYVSSQVSQKILYLLIFMTLIFFLLGVTEWERENDLFDDLRPISMQPSKHKQVNCSKWNAIQIVVFSKWRHSSHQTLDPWNTVVSQNGGDFSTIFRTSTGHKKSRIWQNQNFFRINNRQSMQNCFSEKTNKGLGAL